MGTREQIFQLPVSRRRFLQASAAGGAATAFGAGLTLKEKEAVAQAHATSQTKITKNSCHPCPARCGSDVYTTDGRVHTIGGSSEHPIANGKLCPKGPLGSCILYDPGRFT